jgi:hypothetical protein
MRVAAKPRCAVLFLMVLALGVSLGLPAEDVLDAVYDESETLPYEVIPLSSNARPLVAARTTRATQSSSRPDLGTPSPFAPARFPDTDANRSARAQVLLPLLCTLRC